MKQFWIKKFLIFLGGMTLYGCEKEAPRISTKETGFMQFLDETRLKLPDYFSMKEFRSYIENDDLISASKYVNSALNINVKNPCLHLLNGFIYEEMLRHGDNTKSELAGVAYRSAYTLDPSQWLSVYLMGAHEMKSRRYKEAQKLLADALILKPNQPDILYCLAFCSYYLHDLPVAVSSIARVVAIKPKDPHINRAAAVIFAAAGQVNKAKKHIGVFKELMGEDHPEVLAIEKRVNEWQNVHSRAITRQTYAETTDVEGVISRAGEAVQDIAAVLQKQEAAQAKADAPTVVLDCYLLRSLEETNFSRGNNIMDSLSVSLGTGSDAIASVRREITSPNYLGPGSPASGNWTKTFKYQISPYVLQYNLNIANVTQVMIEVNSRPTISTVVGKPAYFLDGTQYVGAAGGSSGSSIAAVDAGLRLEVTPTEINADGQVVLEITIAGSLFIELPKVLDPIARQLVGTTRSNISSTVRAAFGETIMIGGLYSRSNISTKNGFPFLQDIPLLQYFFANDQGDAEIQSTLYLVTPRRGGSDSECSIESLEALHKPSATMKELQRNGLMAIGEYPTIYYILKALANIPLIADFRSGDLMVPFWGYDYSNLKKKIDQLSSFVLF